MRQLVVAFSLPVRRLVSVLAFGRLPVHVPGSFPFAVSVFCLLLPVPPITSVAAIILMAVGVLRFELLLQVCIPEPELCLIPNKTQAATEEGIHNFDLPISGVQFAQQEFATRQIHSSHRKVGWQDAIACTARIQWLKTENICK